MGSVGSYARNISAIVFCNITRDKLRTEIASSLDCYYFSPLYIAHIQRTEQCKDCLDENCTYRLKMPVQNPNLKKGASDEDAGILPSHGISIDIPSAAHGDRPATVRHM